MLHWQSAGTNDKSTQFTERNVDSCNKIRPVEDGLYETFEKSFCCSLFSRSFLNPVFITWRPDDHVPQILTIEFRELLLPIETTGLLYHYKAYEAYWVESKEANFELPIQIPAAN